jgi:hypothetical protein
MDKLTWFFFSHCHINIYIILKGVIRVNERFLLALRNLWWVTNLLFKRSPLMFHVCPIFTTHGKNLRPLVFVDV